MSRIIRKDKEKAKMNTERIKELMEAKKINNKQLADKIGVTDSQVGYIIRGLKLPSIITAVRMARCLGCTVDELINTDAVI